MSRKCLFFVEFFLNDFDFLCAYVYVGVFFVGVYPFMSVARLLKKGLFFV